MTAAIFLSYRRDSAAGTAGRLFDALEVRFGNESIFMDEDDINPGEDFVEVLNRALDGCSVIIVVIDPQWLSTRGKDGERRIDSPGDFVRIEVERALRNSIHIVPVLVDGAHMPESSDLPGPVRALATKQALEIGRSPRRFRADVDRLKEILADIIASGSRPGSEAAEQDGAVVVASREPPIESPLEPPINDTAARPTDEGTPNEPVTLESEPPSRRNPILGTAAPLFDSDPPLSDVGSAEEPAAASTAATDHAVQRPIYRTHDVSHGTELDQPVAGPTAGRDDTARTGDTVWSSWESEPPWAPSEADARASDTDTMPFVVWPGPPSPSSSAPLPERESDGLLYDLLDRATATILRPGTATAVLRTIVALGPVAVVAFLLLGAVKGATYERPPGEPLTLTVPQLLLGILIFVAMAFIGAVIFGVVAFALTASVVIIAGWAKGSLRWRALKDRSVEQVGFAAAVVGFLLFAGLAVGDAVWMLYNQRISSVQDGYGWAGLLVLLAVGAVGWLSFVAFDMLLDRDVRHSQLAADRRFPLLVGSAALLTTGGAATADWAVQFGGSGRWALYLGLWAFVLLCVLALAVEAFDRASRVHLFISGCVAVACAMGGSLAGFFQLT